MTQLTEQSLKVFWMVQEENEHGCLVNRHEEVDGVLAYGYWTHYPSSSLHFPYALWPQGTLVRDHLLTGTGWSVLEWTIRITEWPKQAIWRSVLKQTLDVMCTSGAKVAWYGIEGYFADPPSLFSPEHMSGGLYAALIPGSNFVCSAQLGQPIRFLNDTQLMKLRSVIME